MYLFVTWRMRPLLSATSMCGWLGGALGLICRWKYGWEPSRLQQQQQQKAQCSDPIGLTRVKGLQGFKVGGV